MQKPLAVSTPQRVPERVHGLEAAVVEVLAGDGGAGVEPAGRQLLVKDVPFAERELRLGAVHAPFVRGRTERSTSGKG